jgi:hypothetical protein
MNISSFPSFPTPNNPLPAIGEPRAVAGLAAILRVLATGRRMTETSRLTGSPGCEVEKFKFIYKTAFQVCPPDRNGCGCLAFVSQDRWDSTEDEDNLPRVSGIGD